jgi:hypothetical protein
MLENETNLLQVGCIVLHMQKEEGMVESQLEHIQRIIAKKQQRSCKVELTYNSTNKLWYAKLKLIFNSFLELMIIMFCFYLLLF